MRERDDLHKEVDDLKRRLRTRDPEDTDEVSSETPGTREIPGVGRITRARAELARRRLVSSSESESRGVAPGPPRAPAAGAWRSRGTPGNAKGAAREGPSRGGSVLTPLGTGRGGASPASPSPAEAEREAS